jgi:uncharacterized protein (TIGR00255 family)
MTGYARVQTTTDELSLTLTLRSVNHRFLDLQLRLPTELEPFEALIRRSVKEKIKRGQLQISASLRWTQPTELIQINDALVEAYLRAYHKIAERHALPADPDLNSLLRIPGIVTSNGSDLDEPRAAVLEPALAECLASALDQLARSRHIEGQGIAADLERRGREIQRLTLELQAAHRGAAERLRQRLESRLTEMLGQAGLDPQRLVQEAAILADRADISEEIQRLSAHVERLLALLAQGDELGKSIDFLAQEMNREANTMLSKTTPLGQDGLRVTEAGLQIKAEIEKIREQAQNLE